MEEEVKSSLNVESLKEDIERKCGELEVVKQELDKTREHLAEMSIKAEECAENFGSRLNESKTSIEAKEMVIYVAYLLIKIL